MADFQEDAIFLHAKVASASKYPDFISDLPSEQETNEMKAVFKIHKEQNVPLSKFTEETPQTTSPSQEQIIPIEEPDPQAQAEQVEPPLAESVEATQ